MSDVKLQETIIIGFHRPNMRHVLVAFKRNLDWNLKLHVAPTWYIPSCKQIFICSHVTFHFIMLPDHH